MSVLVIGKFDEDPIKMEVLDGRQSQILAFPALKGK